LTPRRRTSIARPIGTDLVLDASSIGVLAGTVNPAKLSSAGERIVG
jgi:hypothetical protein